MDCGPSLAARPSCPHGKQKSNFKECSGCPHGKLKRRCKDCKSSAACRLRKNCGECNPSSANPMPGWRTIRGGGRCTRRLGRVACPKLCPHGKQKHDCKECSGCSHNQRKRELTRILLHVRGDYMPGLAAGYSLRPRQRILDGGLPSYADGCAA